MVFESGKKSKPFYDYLTSCDFISHKYTISKHTVNNVLSETIGEPVTKL